MNSSISTSSHLHPNAGLPPEVSRERAPEYRRLEALIQEGNDEKLLRYRDEAVPGTEARAELYLTHMEQHPRAVHALLFCDGEGAQRTWSRAAKHEGIRNTLEALLRDAGWCVNRGCLERTESFHQKVQALEDLAESCTGTVVSRLSSVPGDANGSPSNEVARFMSLDSFLSSFEHMCSEVNTVPDDVSVESNRRSARAVVDQTISEPVVTPGRGHGATRLVLLSDKPDGHAAAQCGDLNKSGTSLMNPVHKDTTVVVHKNPQSVLGIPTAEGQPNRQPHAIARCCNWLWRLVRPARRAG